MVIDERASIRGVSGALAEEVILVGLGATLGGLLVLGISGSTVQRRRSTRTSLALTAGLNLLIGFWAFDTFPDGRRLAGALVMALGVFALYVLLLDVLLADCEARTRRAHGSEIDEREARCSIGDDSRAERVTEHAAVTSLLR